MITITMNNVWSRINGVDREMMEILDRITSYYVEGYQYTKAFRNGYFDNKAGKFKHWDGKKHLITKAGVFPTGLLSRITEALKDNDYEYQIIDQRVKIKKQEPIEIKNYTPRDYQLEALNSVIENERGMIRMATGSGKTLVAGMIVAHYNLPSNVFVVGKDLLYQFYKEMKKILGEENVGIIGDGKYDVKKFNVCSIWTAITAFDMKTKVSLDDEDWAPEIVEINEAKKIEIKKAIENANLVIYDEAHFVATDTIQSIFKASKKCRYVLGMTASPWRSDGADLLLESVCGKCIYNLPASVLIKRGFLCQPKITLVDVPSLREGLPKKYASVYKKYITDNEIRNGLIIQSINKLIKMGRRPLVLVRYLCHGDSLANKLDIPLYFVNGEIDGETREQVKQDFEDGKLKCLIASSIFDTGIDLPCLDALVLAGGGKSTSRTLQRIGRVIRLYEGKKDAIVVDFLDNALYLDKHSATRIAVYETEPFFKLKFPKGFDHETIKRPKKVKAQINAEM